MTEEDLEKAAIENISCDLNFDLRATLEGVGRESFVFGAKWRIKSIWRDAVTQPEDGRLTLLQYGDGFCLIGGPQYWEWENTVKGLGIKRWAYVGDLLPEEEK